MKMIIILPHGFMRISLQPVQRVVYWEHVWVSALNDKTTKNYVFPFHWLYTSESICRIPEREITVLLMCASKIQPSLGGFIIWEYQGFVKISLCDRTLVFTLTGKNPYFILSGTEQDVFCRLVTSF